MFCVVCARDSTFFFFLLSLRPPRSTRPYTIFPHATRFRTQSAMSVSETRDARLTLSLSGKNLERAGDYNQRIVLQAIRLTEETTRSDLARVTGLTPPTIVNITKRLIDLGLVKQAGRSEERRVGKEWDSTCRSRRSPYH